MVLFFGLRPLQTVKRIIFSMIFQWQDFWDSSSWKSADSISLTIVRSISGNAPMLSGILKRVFLICSIVTVGLYQSKPKHMSIKNYIYVTFSDTAMSVLLLGWNEHVSAFPRHPMELQWLLMRQQGKPIGLVPGDMKPSSTVGLRNGHPRQGNSKT